MSKLNERENGVNCEYCIGVVNEETDRLADGTIKGLEDGKYRSSFSAAMMYAQDLMGSVRGSDKEVVIVTGRALERVTDDSPSVDISWSSKDSHYLQRYLENSVEAWNAKTSVLGIKSDKPSVYFDIDGTTGKWYADGQRADGRKFEALEEIIDPANHYFRDIEPHKFMIDVASALNDKGYDVCSLGAADRNTIRDKWDWVHENMSFVKDENIFFCPLGADKSSFVKGNAEISVLIDDYNNNLDTWKGQPIKAINTVNSHQDKYPEIDMTQPEKMLEEYQTLKASLEDEKALEQAFDSFTLMYAKAVEAAVETIENSIRVIEREYAEELNKTFEERRGLLRFDEFSEYHYEEKGLTADGWEFKFQNEQGNDISAIVIDNADSALEAAVPVVKIALDGVSDYMRIYEGLSRYEMDSKEINSTVKQAYEAFKKCPHLNFSERSRIEQTLDLGNKYTDEQSYQNGRGYIQAFKEVNKEQLDARNAEWEKGFNAVAEYYAINLHDTIAAGKTEADFTEREADALETLRAMYKDFKHQDVDFKLEDWERNYQIEKGGAGREAFIADDVCKEINQFVNLMEKCESEGIAELYKREIEKAIERECEKCRISPADMRRIIDESGLSREPEIPQIIEGYAKSNPTYLLTEEEDKELTQLLTKLERNGKTLSNEEVEETISRAGELLAKGNEGNEVDYDALRALTETVARHVSLSSGVDVVQEEVAQVSLTIDNDETLRSLVEKAELPQKAGFDSIEAMEARLSGSLRDEVNATAILHEDGKVELIVDYDNIEATVPLPHSDQAAIISYVEQQIGSTIEDYIENRYEVGDKFYTEEEVIEKAEALIKQEIEDNPEGYSLFFNYDEKISAEDFKEMFEDYCSKEVAGAKKEGRDPFSFYTYIYEQIYDNWDIWERESQKFDTNFYDKLSDEDKAIIDAYIEINNGETLPVLFDDLGFNGVSYDIEDILGSYHVNIMLATEWELNTDLNAVGNMTVLLNEGAAEAIKSLDNAENINHGKYFDNAFAYLIEQQGHSMSEVANILYDRQPVEELPAKSFIRDVRDELSEDNFGKQLAVMITVSTIEDINVLEELAKQSPEYNISVSKDTNLILHDEWSGRCGDLIQLDKDFVFPASMFHHIEVEKAGRTEGRYTIDQTCGFWGGVWKGDIEIDKTGFEPDKVKVDVDKLKSTFKEIEKDEAKKEKKQNVEKE